MQLARFARRANAFYKKPLLPRDIFRIFKYKIKVMSLILSLKEEIAEMRTRKEVYLERGDLTMADDCQWRLNGMNERLDEYSSTWGEFVYVLTNPSMPGIVKIGFTTTSPQQRIKEINSATGVIEKWNLEWSVECTEAHDLEKKAHEYLKEFRVSKNREGFYMHPTQAIAAVQKINEERY